MRRGRRFRRRENRRGGNENKAKERGGDRWNTCGSLEIWRRSDKERIDEPKVIKNV